MSTFFGRFKHWVKVTHPMNSFYRNKTLEDYKIKVKELQQNQKLTKTEADDLDHMKTVLTSCVNPDNQVPIPWAGRTSAFIPTNIPVIGGMILIRPTPITDVCF